MPKKGEKSRKLTALSRGKGVRPPKRWFDMMKTKVSKQYHVKQRSYTKYGKKRIGKIVGGVWSKMSTATKKKVVRKYQR